MQLSGIARPCLPLHTQNSSGLLRCKMSKLCCCWPSLVFPLGSKVFRPSSALSLAGIFTKQEMWIGNSHCGQLVVGFHPGGNFLKSPMTLRLCQRTACQMQDEVPGLPRRSTPLQSRAFTVKIHGLQAAFFQHSVFNAEHYMFMAHQKAA